ncbi:MAG: DsrE/DsrF/DrsH-like family protein [Candidatus Calescibacterium sp.]|nr:DsrE/DsrF/DrsH-like family protein [Candidatus Calescibacterium sp.]MCX7733997.1 DsrE/DsrF/DrsH-like family protein [bacterium]MDW8086404.1 DsrE/DsrF/DrsH-like family protein [Candidatus Calescibacterium sp.]
MADIKQDISSYSLPERKTEEKKDKMRIICFSGDMDKAFAVLTLASTAASLGMDVAIFFTFWGLSLIKKNRKLKGKNFLQKMMDIMMPSGLDSLKLSKMNMAGLGPFFMKILMKKTKSPDLKDLFEAAKESGVKFYACSTSCSILGIDRSEFVDEVEEIVGAATFISEAKDAKISLFI